MRKVRKKCLPPGILAGFEEHRGALFLSIEIVWLVVFEEQWLVRIASSPRGEGISQGNKGGVLLWFAASNPQGRERLLFFFALPCINFMHG